MDPIILHCDLNNFYASVECLKRPELKDVPMAVCGSADDRRGVILAKNPIAKALGVKTAESLWQARKKCPDLITVNPHHDEYRIYSKKVRAIYERFTDLIEPFGIDECWLDVTGSTRLFGEPQEIATLIRNTVKEELGLSISVGISYNKIFAKMGSDMKQLGPIVTITKENFKDLLWPMQMGEMFGAGKATVKKLRGIGVETIGEFAALPYKDMKTMFGKGGEALWTNVNGLNRSPVTHVDFHDEIKSVGHGVTCNRDLTNEGEVVSLFYNLAENVSTRLRKRNLLAKTVQIEIKDNMFQVREYQKPLEYPTRNAKELGKLAAEIFSEKHFWQFDIRAVTIRAVNLIEDNTNLQTSLFVDLKKIDGMDELESKVDHLREKYGENIVKRASSMKRDHLVKTVVEKENVNKVGKYIKSK